MSQTDRFLEVLFPVAWRAQGYAVVSLFAPKGKGGALSRFYRLSDELPRIASDGWLRRMNEEEGYGVYIAHAPRKENLGPRQRGKKTDIAFVPAVVVDLDVANPGAHRSTNLVPSFADAEKIVEKYLLPPSMVVNSGYGLQAWWCLNTPVDVGTAEMLAQTLQGGIRTLAAPYHVDETWSADRVWRLPGFLNTKIPGSPVPVTLVR